MTEKRAVRSTIPAALVNTAAYLIGRVTETEKAYGTARTLYEVLKQNKHSDALRLHQASNDERNAWKDLCRAELKLEEWVSGYNIVFPQSQIDNGEADILKAGILRDRQAAVAHVKALNAAIEPTIVDA